MSSLLLLKDIHDWVSAFLESMRDELRLPPFSSVIDAGTTACHDSWQALHSIYALLSMIGLPLYRLLQIIAQPLLYHGWNLLLNGVDVLRRLVVPWVLQNGGTQIRNLAIVVYRFHKQRTHQELFVEGCILVGLGLLYRLNRYIRQQRLIMRAQTVVVHRRVHSIQQFCSRSWNTVADSYHRFIFRVSSLSIALGLVIPHLLFWTFAALVSYTTKNMRIWGRSESAILKYLATETPLVWILQIGYPIAETLVCFLHDDHHDETLTQNDNNNKKKKNRSKSDQKYQKQKYQHRLESVLDYWTVYAASQIASAVLKSLPWFMGSRFVRSSMVITVHLWWVLYLAGLLYVSLHHHHHPVDNDVSNSNHEMTGHNGGDGAQPIVVPSVSAANKKVLRPNNPKQPMRLRLLKTWAAFLVTRFGRGTRELNGVLSIQMWQQLLAVLIKPLDMCVFVRLLPQSTRDQIVHVLEEARVIIVPAGFCFVPFVSIWAVRFTQWVIPLTKHHSQYKQPRKLSQQQQHLQNLEESAQYWVLHVCVVNIVLSRLPLFNIIRLAIWWYASWPSTIRWLWPWCGRELETLADMSLGGNAQWTDLSLVRSWQVASAYIGHFFAAVTRDDKNHHHNNHNNSHQEMDDTDVVGVDDETQRLEGKEDSTAAVGVVPFCELDLNAADERVQIMDIIDTTDEHIPMDIDTDEHIQMDIDTDKCMRRNSKQLDDHHDNNGDLNRENDVLISSASPRRSRRLRTTK